MKRILLAIPFVTGSFFASAQELGIGIKGGYNNANMTVTSNGTIQDKNALSSFNVGAYLDIPLAPVFSIQPGLMFSGKGVKFTSGDKNGDNWVETKTNPIYLEIPVNAVGKIPFAPHSNIFFGAGPYVAMGIAGKKTVSGETLGAGFSDESNIKFGNDDPINGNNGNTNSGNVKRYDWGLNFLAGFEIHHFTFNANYGLGLTNIAPGSGNSDNDKYKNRVLSLSIGFLF